MAAAANQLGGIVRELGEASAGSNQELGLAAGRLAALAEVESDWVDAHDADPCYEVVASAFEEAVDTLAQAATAFGALARSFTPTEAEGQTAGTLLSEGSEAIDAARAAALEARAACR
jgi:hypothetical protein